MPDSLLYTPSEGIYSQFHKESDIDMDDMSKKKVPVEINNVTQLNQKDFDWDVYGADIDILESDPDDDKENYGAGTVIVCDNDTYTLIPEDELEKAESRLTNDLQKGHLSFILNGKKLTGKFILLKRNTQTPGL